VILESKFLSVPNTATDNTNSTSGSIGGDENGATRRVNGTIDEVRAANRARSAEWIKLSYENQREGTTVVRIE
jgi:hypothetical protein